MKRSDYSFEQPYIKESIFKTNDCFVNSAKPEPISMNTKASSYTSYQDGQKEEYATCGLTIEIGEESEKSPFYVKVTMEAVFSWCDKEKRDIEMFLKVNVPSLLTGYIRPIITFLTSNSPYPPFHLSFINFNE